MLAEPKQVVPSWWLTSGPITVANDRRNFQSRQACETGTTGEHAAHQRRTRNGFQLPTGPGRCNECGWHTPTQGHADDCTANG